MSDSGHSGHSGRHPRLVRVESGRHGLQRDVNDEMEFHIAMRTEKLVRLGLPPDVAREQALQQFGDLSTVRTECLTIDQEHQRAMNRANRLQNLRQDLLYALRSLSRNKGFAFVTILTLAVGIGANTAIFSLVDVLILRPLPVPHAEQLVTVGNPARVGSMSDGSPRSDLYSYPLYKDMRDGARTLSGLYASGRTGRVDVVLSRNDSTGLGTGAAPDHPSARLVSGNYFSVLQIRPHLGRTFAAGEGQAPGDAPVVVIGYDYWQRRFGGDSSAIGRVITVNGAPLTVVGVAPRSFPSDIVDRVIDVWIPVTMQEAVLPNSHWLNTRSVSWLNVMGRRAPGVSIAQVRAEMSALVARSLEAHATPAEARSIEQDLAKDPVPVESGAQGFSYYRSQYAESLVTLMAAVAVVLLVVCANVANLLLARATARAREMSVRMALGASRLRLVQQLLTESMLIAVAGGALGALVATWASQALLQLANGNRGGIALDTGPDARVLAFSACVSLATAALFGLVPALRATRVELGTALRSSGRNVAGNGGKYGAGRVLVVAQVAMSVLLLVGTGMLVRSMRRLEGSDIGAARDHLVIAAVDAERVGYRGARLASLMRALTERMQTTPGVVGASASENGIFSGTESASTFQVEGFTARADDDTTASYDDVGAGYFRTIGARVLQGREFEERDNETGARVAVVNATMARFYFPKGDAIGHHLTMDSVSREIVGIVADVNGRSLRTPPSRRFYIPMAQYAELPGAFYLQVRTSDDPARMILPLRRSLLAVDPQLVIRSIDPLNDLIRDSIRQDRLVAQVVTLFGALALLLSALGLYGVMAYATVRRTSEFGLRLALGAVPGSIVRLVLREALGMTVLGVALGLPLAFGMTQLLRQQLFGVGTVDVPSVVLATLVLVVTAALAGYVPAMRASRVAPLDALRAD